MTAAADRQDDLPPPTDPARRFAALRGCERILSGARPRSIRERLAALAEGAEQLYDLDEATDFYGNGIVRALERRVAGLLGMPEAVYFPTGTMAQQAALQYWADGDGRTVAMHPLSHPEVHEHRAYSVLSGLRTVWPTTAPRLPTPAELRTVGEPFTTLMLELPLRDAGFVLPTWAELTALVEEARQHAAYVHLDGARLWESGPHFGRTLPEIAALADSVYVSCYKTLGGISGALVAGDEEFARGVRVWRHRYGGQLFQQWPAVLSALAGLEAELPRLGSYVANAKAVAAALAETPGSRVNPDPPHTHQFQFWLPYPAEALNRANVRLAELQGVGLFGGWDEPGPLPGFSMTEITASAAALDWTPKEITEAVALFLEIAQV
ncbi:beta-eliminating lyase-related protein [Kitasatospora sp. NPDC049258]|uniref:threonine aldolase family protein n=1 Tax=Kitasatospora sp. NPDC049258 TaxID=3155394 RepID=UPI00341EF52E